MERDKRVWKRRNFGYLKKKLGEFWGRWAKVTVIDLLKAYYAPKMGVIHALELLLPNEMTGQKSV